MKNLKSKTPKNIKNKKIKIGNNSITYNKTIYIYVLLVYTLLLLLSIYIVIFDNNFVCNCDIFNTVDYFVNNNTNTNSFIHNINKSIPKTYTINNILKPVYVTNDDKCFVNEYNKSVILNEVKDLHLKELTTECNIYINKISQLESHISYNNMSYSNLLKDLDVIIKEFNSTK